MSTLWLPALLAYLAYQSSGTGGTSPTPSFSAATITNTATNLTNYFAPNTFITITGQNLAYTTQPITAGDIHGTKLPNALIGTGLVVLFGLVPADMYYVSPTVLKMLIPSNLGPGVWTVQLELDGLNQGPAAQITLNPTAPALFMNSDGTAVAERQDGSLISPATPVHAGELAVLYATGLGSTSPPTGEDQIPQAAAPLIDMADFQVLFNGTPVPPGTIYYAGVTPTFAGLYQINVLVPASAGTNPTVQVSAGGVISPAGPVLAVQ